MHDIQKIILKRLLGQNDQKYSNLTKGYSYEENVVFHLKSLISKGFINKQNGLYSITVEGIKEITKYGLSKLVDIGFKTFFIGFLCNYGNKYLVKEHPQGSVDFYNLPSGKPYFGESVQSALIRIFQENTGLSLPEKEIKFYSLHLKTILTSSGEVLFDDAFAIYKIELAKNQFEKIKPGTNIRRMDVGEIQRLNNRWPEIDICILRKNTKHYLAYEFISDYIL